MSELRHQFGLNNGRGHYLALRVVKPFAQPDVIHLIITPRQPRAVCRRSSGDDNVPSSVPRGASRISFYPAHGLKVFRAK
jgi:hypothetical protein